MSGGLIVGLLIGLAVVGLVTWLSISWTKHPYHDSDGG